MENYFVGLVVGFGVGFSCGAMFAYRGVLKANKGGQVPPKANPSHPPRRNPPPGGGKV